MPTKEDLKQMQALPLSAKVELSKQRIREWVDYAGIDKVRVSFSGGKDSEVVLHLIRQMYGDQIPAVFVNTGLEFPQIRQHVLRLREEWGNIEIIQPELRFDQVIKQYGYPVFSKMVAQHIEDAKRGVPYALNHLNGFETDGTKASEWLSSRYTIYKKYLDVDFNISQKCCRLIKERPLKEYEKRTDRRFPVIGTLAEESTRRTLGWLKVGCNMFNGSGVRSAPLSFWTEQDILAYIDQNHLPLASVYGDLLKDEKTGKYTLSGRDRTGCMFCMFGVQVEERRKAPNRFQLLKETNPKQYAFCIGGGEYDENGKWGPSYDEHGRCTGLGIGHVLDEIGVSY